MLKRKEFTRVQKVSGFSLWMLTLALKTVAVLLQDALVKPHKLAGEVTLCDWGREMKPIFHHIHDPETALLLQEPGKMQHGLGSL